ncbi:toxin-antitoxin system, antitoxin component [Desulfoscipio geothermicus]|jgi:hypothetical protein|uniref:Toxin-antitoxin system, antitoxin component n=1 Tax=Desulfoscipio geothermicus DSM 3669 TaxID=1121426 RepID=A0A1I6D0X7_9FIRM|nr:toxin-antitoxin system, antitoxin component [Desulfoscipio geothermicus]SFQ99040.1 hypothetical protein SAMN05660706_10414 [Desulfoscipio geothermicus DSM 3669]
MPQLSLYIDDETLSKIETAAKINQISISKWVSERLKESLANSWPENYASLFGSVDDDSFVVEKRNSFFDDSKREEL